MRNIFFTLLFLLHFTSVFSQDFIALDIEGPEEYPFIPYAPLSYNALALEDGNFVFTQSVYDFDNQRDCGVRFVKMSPDGEIIGSIFYEFEIEGAWDFLNSSLIENPYEENEFIYTYFSYGENYSYNAVFFDYNLNIVDDISKPFPEQYFNMSHMSYLNLDNNFIYVWAAGESESDCEYRIAEVDIYGNLIKSSFLMEFKNAHYAHIFSCFVYDEEKKQYGFITDVNGTEIIFNIFDKDLKFVEEHTLSGYDGYDYTYIMGYGCVVRSEDGNFVFTQQFYSKTNYFDRGLFLCKLDKDFKVIEKDIIAYDENGEDLENYSSRKEWKDIIQCEDGSFYCIWCKDFNVVPKVELYVSYYDKDFNLLWERCCKDDMYWSGNYTGIDVLKDGGLVLAGNVVGEYAVASPHTSVIILKNNGAVISENPNDIRPYSFYPNPADDVLNIRFSPDVNVEKVEIFGMDGKLYHEQNFNMETINIDGLSNGIYMMKVTFDNGDTYTDKVVKN